MKTFIENEAAWLVNRVYPINFIPRYSNGYFDMALEIREAVDYIIASIPRFIIIFFPMLFAFRKSEYLETFWIITFGVIACLLICNHMLFPTLRYYKYGVGFLLVEDGIVEMKSSKSLGRCFGYDYVRNAIKKGRYTYKTDYLEINCIRFRLRFFWENKDEKGFEHYKSVHKLLEEKIGMKLPPFNKEIQKLLNAERSLKPRFNFAWWLCVIFYLFVNLCCYATAYDHPEGLIIMGAVIIGGLYIAGFYFVSRSVMQCRYYIRRLNAIKAGIEKHWYWAEHGISIYVTVNLILCLLSLIHIVFLLPHIDLILKSLG